MTEFGTPRMLARTLFVLRKSRRKLSLHKLATSIGFSDSQLQRFEDRENSISFEVLQRLQLRLGVPNGILLTISHVAAITRDLNTATDQKIRTRERKKLKMMAHYLRDLADRIDGKGKLNADKPPLTNYPGLNADNPKTWDNILVDLILSTQAHYDPDKPTVFEDHVSLRQRIEADSKVNGCPVDSVSRPEGR
jgi:transcriptional regulator with XRE-family HTH domain